MEPYEPSENVMDILDEIHVKLKTLEERYSSSNIKNVAYDHLKRRTAETKEIVEELNVLKEATNTLRAKCEEMEVKQAKENMTNAQLEKQVNENAARVRAHNEKMELYSQRLDLMKKTKPNSKDLKLLDSYKEKLKAYRKLTGVVWDYASCNENQLAGYIRHLDNQKLVAFHLDTRGKSPDQVVREMWQICQKKSSAT